MMRKSVKKSGSDRPPTGSALVLVIVITVLLATVGAMFVMMSRVGSATSSAISDNRELSAAVDVVVNRIQTVLVEDLLGYSPYTGTGLHLLASPAAGGRRPDYSKLNIINEPWDAPLSNLGTRFRSGDDPWLASLEPVGFDPATPLDPGDDRYLWPNISDLYGDFPFFGILPGLPAVVAEPNDADNLAPADADGDGVTDSRWIPLHRSPSRGRPIFAAVRIIDNCGMLNLNTVHTADADSKGEHLSAVDYERFLRGSDTNPGVPGDPYNIRRARLADGIFDPCDPCDSYQHYHDDVVMKIENPGPDYVPFDIGDELEIRNRYLLTSPVEARFERVDVANYTLDAGGGPYGALRIPRTTADFDRWKIRMDHRNFDGTSGGDPCDVYKYDRRHVCTFYSFDRNIRRRMYPFVDVINDIVDPNRIDRLLENNPVFSPGPGVPVNINNDISSNSTDSRRSILHLLYALRAYFVEMNPEAGYRAAARRSAQLVANMIDYIDDNNPTTEGPFFDSDTELYDYGEQKNENPTYINREIIRNLILEVSTYDHGVGIGDIIDVDSPLFERYDFGLGTDDIIYGYERQPFISELYRYYDDTQVPPEQYFAIELCNPYMNPNGAIDLEGWRIVIGETPYEFSSGDNIEAAASSKAEDLGRLVIISDMSVPVSSGAPSLVKSTLFIGPGEILKLQRPDPADPTDTKFITVDATEMEQTDFLLSPGNGEFVSKRDDRAWRFADSSHYLNDSFPTLGAANELTSTGAKGFQMPVLNKNKQLATLHDFEMVLSIGNEKIGDDPNAITMKVGSAANESYVRFDIESRPELLEYICFMNRPERNLPGRININTATMEVIRAAIPPQLGWEPDADNLAQNIISYRGDPCNGPFERVSDLLEVPGFKQMIDDEDPNTGDSSIDDDFEERDWILSRVSNIFTVRSDVFTAYILVRIGNDGPQKRMIAIFDRSGVFDPADKPRLVALHPVPDPR